ncbi:P-loop containing nucleoside triphosphate hydrolase protein [Penicillium frequentans]|uniref:P-loop containing nucleoside triphosphate hydrolase protein n=1 Tax=Penicillium frequentans TaxID=3151616 RepID=A0AAD6CY70_9EURO|nr:P-loop containing nucleoside triphosphate hydrolase protein [Penicillium glabrum]
MCPEISTLVRNLMYPELQDDDKTKNRPAPRGLQDRVIFIQHDHPEVNFAQISDSRDEGSKESKRNTFEVEFVLKIVKYLGQQGYGTDRLVVLTPYLGQLHLLRDELSKQNDPVLNDLDSYDLVRAGLVSQANADHSKRPIKLSTIDNYQGEESDIVIASLTRSNKQGKIGFMAAAERVNVLLSRARDILIIVGNAETFLASRKGKVCWGPLLNHMKSNRHIYNGLPIRCAHHPHVATVVEKPADFERECPDGGCAAPCGVKLNCGVHDCPYKCHQLSDHSRMECKKLITSKCSRGHSRTLPCAQTSTACRSCFKEDQAQKRRIERDARLDAERQRKQSEYALVLAEAQAEIAHLKKIRNDEFEDGERQRILTQCQEEINTMTRVPESQTAVNAIAITAKVTESPTPLNHSDLSGDATRKNEAQKPHIKQAEIEAPQTSSTSKNDWDYQKQFLNARSVEIDALMEMIGLEAVKEKFLAIKSKVDVSISQGIKLDAERFGTVFMGNPGTGKTTVARLYAKFLASVGVIPGNDFFETTGSKLANEGVTGCQKTLDKILEKGGGAFFIDEAYQLTQGTFGGTQVLDFLIAEIENLTGKIVFILAGYQRSMEMFLGHNQGLTSRFPHELKFGDYADGELLQILAQGIQNRWRQQMKVEDGLGGLYCRIVARRIGRGRGKEGFGNARAVENAIAKIADHQSVRLRLEKLQAGVKINSFFLTKEDLIGPEPSRAVENSEAWKRMNAMIGLNTVKDSLEALLGTFRWNYDRELLEQSPVAYSLNKVFLGSPGTGKTTVAKLYGQILVDMGMLSNGEVVIKNPSDFVGSAIGESEKNTKAILASTVGKVLVIDEAYGLFGGGNSDGTGARSDIYRTAVVDTIVAEVQSVPGEDRCVLLLGYKDQMQQMFQHVNPGLSRRFPMDQSFVFEDFTREQMYEILNMKLKEQDLGISEIGRQVALEIIERSRNRLNFGNAGEVDILLNSAKMRLQKRITSSKGSSKDLPILDAPDFDENFDRADKNELSVRKLFDGVVGLEECILKLEGYQELVRRLRKLNMDPREEVPFNFLFRGPPGTGKTSTARKMGQIYYDMGLLSSAEVIEASATDLMGQYVGQTGPKTQKLLETALGKVLFIDEAYRLADGKFGQEAMGELVDNITKPAFFHKLIIILAGYDDQLNELMAINPGLTSRFPESLPFYALSSGSCIQLLTKLLSNRQKSLKEKGEVDLDLAALENSLDSFFAEMEVRFVALSRTPGWANARDIETLAKEIFKKSLRDSEGATILVSEGRLLETLDCMLSDRSSRDVSERLPFRHSMAKEEKLSESKYQTTSIVNMDTNLTERHDTIEEQQPVLAPDPREHTPAETRRDTGVADEVWEQLQQDKATADALDRQYLELQKAEREQRQIVQNFTAQEPEPPSNPDDNSKRLHELARLRRESERREQEAILERLAKDRAAGEQKRRVEERKQQKLREMGVCPVGFRWIKSGNGYRCAGGSHFVDDADLA